MIEGCRGLASGCVLYYVIERMRTDCSQHKWKKFLFPGIFLLIAAVAIFRSTSAGFTSNDGSTVTIKSPSLFESIWDSACSITYKPRNGENTTIRLSRSFFEFPVLLMRSSERSDHFLCLYENDVELRLLDVDPTRKVQAFQPNASLAWIVCSSQCNIEDASVREWKEAAVLLGKMTTTTFRKQSLLIFFGKENLVKRMNEQIRFRLDPDSYGEPRQL